MRTRRGYARSKRLPTSQWYSFSLVSVGVVRKESAHKFRRKNRRVRRCLLRCVVLVNLAGQCGQNLVCGRIGMFPLWLRILDMVPSFLYSTYSAMRGKGKEERRSVLNEINLSGGCIAEQV